MLKNIGKNWTRDEENNLILHFKKYGIDFEQISKIHGRTTKAIRMRLEIIIRKDVDNNITMDDICKKYNCNKSDVDFILSSTEPKKMSIDKKLEQLEELLIKIQKKQNRILKFLQK